MITPGVIIDEEGIDPVALLQHVELHHQLAGFRDLENRSLEEFYSSDVDVLIPAALENTISKSEAEKIRARVILEGANGPVTAKGEKALLKKGIDIIPDVLANAGGVIVSYFEWIQNIRSESWDVERVNERLNKTLKKAYAKVLEIYARGEGEITMRDACYMRAMEKLASVYETRGIFP